MICLSNISQSVEYEDCRPLDDLLHVLGIVFRLHRSEEGDNEGRYIDDEEDLIDYIEEGICGDIDGDGILIVH